MFFSTMVLLVIVILLFLGYSSLILYYWRSWVSIPGQAISNAGLSTPLSVLIPARNEEDNIGRLLQSLHEQTYPRELVEIIVIDDHSTDRTAEIVNQFPGVRLLQLTDDVSNSYKKKALETGITAATGDLVVTTDADCWCSADWLRMMVSFYEEKKPVFIAAPVSIEGNSSFLGIFQAFDFAVLQGITGASVYKQAHSMCNGANLAYERKAFYEVNGFSGIDDIASGDDMLLMHKIAKRYPGRTGYLRSREAIVYTRPMNTWKAFFNQRIRWASKAARYDDKRIVAVLLMVYLFNLSFVALIIAGWWNDQYWLLALALWTGKTLVEWPFVAAVTGFFHRRSLLKYFFFLQPLHIFYTVLSGLFGQLGKYEWKGRWVR